MELRFSSSIDLMNNNAQSYTAGYIKQNPNIYQDIANKKMQSSGINMDTYKHSPAMQDTRLSLSKTYGFLGYNTFDLSGISNAIKKVMIEYKLENEMHLEENIVPIDVLFEQYSEISDEFVISILQLSETVQKPKKAQDMDDLRWGMLVNLGKEIGMDDPDGLLEITQQDLKMYYDLRHNHNSEAFEKLGDYDQNGNLVKKYENPEDIWKDIFLTDGSGNYLKDRKGNLIRNEDFTYTTSMQIDDSVPIRDLTWKKYNYNDDEVVKVHQYGAGDIMNLTASIIDGNFAAFTLLANYERGQVPTHKAYYESHYIPNAKNDAEKLFIYKKNLVYKYQFFLHMVRDPRIDLSYEGQREMYSRKLDNSRWVTFKPFEF